MYNFYFYLCHLLIERSTSPSCFIRFSECLNLIFSFIFNIGIFIIEFMIIKFLMNVNSTPFKLFLYLLIFIFAFYINYHYANKGLYPIDTFAFFDSGILYY